MNFSFDQEQLLLRDSLQRYIEHEYDFQRRRSYQAEAQGFSRTVWGQLADMGVLGALIPQAYGGFGGSGPELIVIMEAIGKGLVVEPFLATAVLGAQLIVRSGNENQKRELLPRVAEGRLLLAAALSEAQGRYDFSVINTLAISNGERYTLDGTKTVVLHGAQADKLIVSARVGGGGIGLFLVDRTASGIEVRDYPTIDGLRAAEISLCSVEVDNDALLGSEHQGLEALEAVLDIAVAALCAEAVGVMEVLNMQTLEYIKNRKQFGKPLGGFQVLQHMAADMFIHCEQAKSLAYLAAIRSYGSDVRERRRVASAAKTLIGKSGRWISQASTQLHGGMGLTEALPANHYAKRLTAIDFWFGDADYHVERFIATEVAGWQAGLPGL